MAFVARRNSQGKLVDRRVVSGCGDLTQTVLLTELKEGKHDYDDDVKYETEKEEEVTDTETLLCHSNRTFGAPTVRYVNVEETTLVVQSAKIIDPLVDWSADNDNMSSMQAAINEIDAHLEANKPKILSHAGSGDANQASTMLVSLPSYTIYSAGGGDADSAISAAATETKTLQHLDHKQFESFSDTDNVTVCQLRKPAAARSHSQTYLKRVAAVENMHMRFGEDEVSDIDDTFSRGTYDVEKETLRLEAGCSHSPVRNRFRFQYGDYSSDSACSWTEMYSSALKPSESRSNIVPSLSLKISETASSGSSTYYRNLNDEKNEDRGKAAYEAWLNRKERLKQQQQQAAKKQREAQEAELAMRQRLSRESYERWCKEKQRHKKKNTSGVSSMVCKSSSNTSSSGSTGSTQSMGDTLIKSNEETRLRVKEWERLKEEQQQREREQLRQKQQEKQLLDQNRKQMSQRAWQDWIKTAEKRPKPVPLNQGFDTLRGTISNIYINPVPWVSIIDANDGRSD